MTVGWWNGSFWPGFGPSSDGSISFYISLRYFCAMATTAPADAEARASFRLVNGLFS